MATAYALTVALTKSPECQELRGFCAVATRTPTIWSCSAMVLKRGIPEVARAASPASIYQPMSGAWLKAFHLSRGLK